MNFLGKLFGQSWDQYNAWELHWVPDGKTWAFAALAVLIPVMLVFFWTSLSKITRRWKKILVYGLRLGALGLLVLVLLQPRLELKNIQPLKNTLAVLLDDSKSMSIKTFPSEETRRDQVQQVVTRHQEFFNGLRSRYDVEFFFASDHIEPVSQGEALGRYQTSAVNTDFHRVFDDLLKHYQGKSLQGLMLFSDGADLMQEAGQLSEEFKKTLVRFQGPIHTLQAGNNDQFKDLAVERLDAADFGFANQAMTVEVSLGAYSMGNKNVPLVLREGDKILTSKMISLKEEDGRYQAELEFTPVSMGKHIYSVSAPLYAGESVETNNGWEFQVKVVRDRLRVLHLNGRPSWDSRFLREVLANNPKVDLLSFFILRSLTDDVDAPTSELSLIPFPSNLLLSDYLNSFDLVIFHNFRFKPFVHKKNLTNLKDYVEGGGAFLMIGGDLSFQNGGYERTPVEEIIPVAFRRNENRFLLESFRMNIPDNLVNHPILRLDSDRNKNKKIWSTLPTLDGLNLGLVPDSRAQVLGTTQVSTGKQELPVLAAAKIGEGRTMSIATDSSWHWNFRRVGEGGSGRYYQKFWENVIAWLTGDPETQLLKVETDKEKYRENEKVLVQFKLLGEDYNPRTDQSLDLVVSTWPGNQEIAREVLKTDAQGEGRYTFHPAGEGFYSARVTLHSDGKPLSREERFSVFSPRVEFQKPRVNSELLKTFASVTGGVYQELGADTRLADLPFPNPEVEIKTSTLYVSLWDNWWSYGLILGLLGMEWWVRRKSGLS